MLRWLQKLNPILIMFLMFAIAESYIIYLLFFRKPDYIDSVGIAMDAMLYPSFVLFVSIYTPLKAALANPNEAKSLLIMSAMWLVEFVSFFAFAFKGTGLLFVARDRIVHSAFTSLYFSIMTLTSASYGDYIPANDAGRLISLIEALLGYLVLALFVAAFVDALKNSRKHSRGNPDLLELALGVAEAATNNTKIALGNTERAFRHTDIACGHSDTAFGHTARILDLLEKLADKENKQKGNVGNADDAEKD